MLVMCEGVESESRTLTAVCVSRERACGCADHTRSSIGIHCSRLCTMSLSTLPAVLAQLLMHSLQAKEILALARCCKWTLECSDSAFAWRHCPPLSGPVNPALLPASRLLRWIPLLLSWPFCGSASPAQFAELLAVSTRLCVGGLQIWNTLTASEHRAAETLLCRPSISQSLRCLCVDLLTPALVPLIARLPRLTSLQVTHAQGHCCSPDQFAPLISAPALTELDLCCDLADRRVFRPCLEALQLLRRITLRAPCFRHAYWFPVFCRLPSIGRLTYLCLADWPKMDMRNVRAKDLAEGFGVLSSLHELELRSCPLVSRITAQVAHAPVLTRMTLTGSTDLSDATLAQLLQDAPRLWVITVQADRRFKDVAARFPGRIVSV